MTLEGMIFLVVLLKARYSSEHHYALEAFEIVHRSIVLIFVFQSLEDSIAVNASIVVVRLVMRGKPVGSSEGDFASTARKVVCGDVVVLKLTLRGEGEITLRANPRWIMSFVAAMIVDGFEATELLLAGIAPVEHDLPRLALLDGVWGPV
jgi:hypothetical protein